LKKLERVYVRVNGDMREYPSAVEAIEYLESEERSWRWLLKLPSLYLDAATEMYEELFKKPVEGPLTLLSGGVRSVELGSKRKHLETGSAESILIGKTRQEYGDLTAALVLLFLNKNTRSLLTNSPTIKKLVDNPNLAFERTVAIQIGLSLQDFVPLAVDSRSLELRRQVERFTEHTSLVRNAVNGYASDLTDEIIASKARINELGKSIGRSYARRKKVYSHFASKARQNAKVSIEETKAALDSAKAAYHDQVDLNASVQYWTVRRRSHSIFKFIWFIAVVVSMVTTFLSMLAYYGYGGAAGLSHMLREKAPAEAVNQVAASPGVTAKILGQNASDLSLAVADLAGAALLITLLGVIIKITLRQFNTHSHLSLEAAERITFTKTYLALLNEGKLKSDEDRRLILESLFRSTQSGAVAEIPFSSPVELILKTLGDKKAP
jgi:hypothetical protein